MFIGAIIGMKFVSPMYIGDLVWAQLKDQLPRLADLALPADAERGNLIWFGIVAVLLIL